MYLEPDDARTDVILAAVAAVLGLTAHRFVVGTGAYPRSLLIGGFLDLLWILALTALVPVLLARYREEGVSAFGFRDGAPTFGSGRRDAVLLALPGIATGLGVLLVLGRGQLPLSLVLAPVTGGDGILQLVLGLLGIAARTLGALVLLGFLAVRARDAFPRSPEVSLVQFVRTVSLALVGVAVVGGLLRVIGGRSFSVAALQTLGLAAILLVVDRLLVTDRTVPRATVLTPLVVLTVAQVFSRGGLFFGDLLGGLTAAALGGGAALAIAVAATSRRGTALTAGLVLAVHWWPTCLSPLALGPLGGAPSLC